MADWRRVDRRAGQYRARGGYLVLPLGVKSLTLSSSSSEVTTKRSVPIACADDMSSFAPALTEYVARIVAPSHRADDGSQNHPSGWVQLPTPHRRELPRLTLAAICNRYGLSIGASFAPVVRVLIYLAYPIAKPIGMVRRRPAELCLGQGRVQSRSLRPQLLDHLLGAHDESITYRKAELKTFVSLGIEDKLEEDEVALIGSMLEFSGKTVNEVMVSAKRWIYTWRAKGPRHRWKTYTPSVPRRSS